ncbi:MAG: 2-dehydropantoate 2-reductase [Chloroflexi bacterium]|nr:2-dehydropantoate 2-reductase [Chloroflexota bacterium]
MRIAVMGSGGVGGYFGGLLAQAGEEVTFIARGAHLEALRTHGLTIQSRVTGDCTLAVSATDDPSSVGAVDLILFCVKTYDLDAAAAQLHPLVGPHTMVLPLQNGLDSAERLARILGPAGVLGGVAYVVASRAAPGVIVHHGLNKIVFGEVNGGSSPRTEQLRDMFQRTAITGELNPDIRVPMWEKFITLTATGGVLAMTRLPIGLVRACPETSALFRGVMEEAVAVGQALGIPLPEDCVDQQWKLVSGVDPSARGSMSHDLLAGRRLEIEALNGTVVRLGWQVGISTPLNFVVYAALKPYAEGAPPA